MKVVVLQSNYIPWKGYFDLINDADLFIFYDEVKYTKNDWRNRNQIYTKNGLQWLTIPVAYDYVHHKISDVQLDPDKWQSLHWKSLFYGYKAAPYFFQLESLAKEFLIDRKWSSLKELNQYTIQEIAKLIGIKTAFRDSTEYDLQGDRVQRLLNLLVQAKATHYISGPAGKEYLLPEIHLFEEKGIQVEFKNYPSYKEYTQLSSPFLQNVSILDTIANVPYDQIANVIWNTK